MKKSFIIIILLTISVSVFTGCKESKLFGPKEYKVENHLDSVSYAIGLDIGKNFVDQKIEIQPEALAQGLKDYLEDRALFDDQEKDKVISAFRQELAMKAREESMKNAETNRQDGEKWLAENKKKEGVVELPSGLQYKVIREGKGPRPTANDVVKVHYKGTLIDGTVFDASYDRGEPIEFALNQVIPGWTEGIQLMNAGSKYELYIPSKLAYGDQGIEGAIPGGSTLIFEVELLSFKPGEAAKK